MGLASKSSERGLCEARRMAAEVYEDNDVDPCLNKAAILTDTGHWLCIGCKEALEQIIGISIVVVRKVNERN